MVPCSQFSFQLKRVANGATIYTNNNVNVAEDLFFIKLGALKLFWEHPGFKRRHVSGWAGARPGLLLVGPGGPRKVDSCSALMHALPYFRKFRCSNKMNSIRNTFVALVFSQ